MAYMSKNLLSIKIYVLVILYIAALLTTSDMLVTLSIDRTYNFIILYKYHK